MNFEYPHLLWLLAIPLLLAGLYLYRELAGRRPHLRVSTSAPWMQGGGSILAVLRHLPFALRTAALCLIIVALARPRSSSEIEKIDSEGIDIVLVMDVSTSMLARDFTPDRISATKDIAIEFISQRPSDRMGIVVFAGESYTQCPLTTDRATLINLMKEVQTDLIEDGTAIGNGLATAVARVMDSDAPSRVVILLTDGVNNSGEVAPQTAAEIAKTYGVRVYTIGVGANGMAPYPVMTPWASRCRTGRWRSTKTCSRTSPRPPADAISARRTTPSSRRSILKSTRWRRPARPWTASPSIRNCSGASAWRRSSACCSNFWWDF